MEWFILALVAIIYSFGYYLTYTPSCRNQWWYYPVGMVTWGTASFLWLWTAKYLNDEKRIYVYSFFWDSLMCIICYGLPLIFFNVKVNFYGIIGVLLVILGLVFLKVGE